MTITYKKINARKYQASTGEIAEFFTSKEYGEKNAKGWYITSADGNRGSTRFDTLRDVKAFLGNRHKEVAA